MAVSQRHRPLQAQHRGRRAASWCSSATRSTTATRPSSTRWFTSCWRAFPWTSTSRATIDVADVDVAYYDRVTDPAGSFYSQLVTTPELSLTYLGFDVTKPPFDDANVRQAFAMAVDKQKLASLMFQRHGGAGLRHTAAGHAGVQPGAANHRLRCKCGQSAAGGLQIRLRRQPAPYNDYRQRLRRGGPRRPGGHRLRLGGGLSA